LKAAGTVASIDSDGMAGRFALVVDIFWSG
jgi:hypothetical protein